MAEFSEIHKVLNNLYCFSIPKPLDEETLFNKFQPSANWLEEFSDFLAKNQIKDAVKWQGVEPFKETILKELHRHLGIIPSCEKTILIQFVTQRCLKLYAVMTKKIDYKNYSLNYKEEEAGFIATQLLEGLCNCAIGVSERLYSIWSRITAQESLENILWLHRIDIINRIARATFQQQYGGLEVHNIDLYMIAGEKCGYGVKPANFYPQACQEPILMIVKEQFKKLYRPLLIIQYIEGVIEGKLRTLQYKGPCKNNESYNYELVNTWVEYLNLILIPRVDLYDVCCVNLLYHIVDINWSNLRKLIVLSLINKGIFFGDRTEFQTAKLDLEDASTAKKNAFLHEKIHQYIQQNLIPDFNNISINELEYWLVAFAPCNECLEQLNKNPSIANYQKYLLLALQYQPDSVPEILATMSGCFNKNEIATILTYKDRNGDNAFFIAVKKNAKAVQDILTILEKNKDPDTLKTLLIQTSGRVTPLMLAAEYQPLAVRYILKSIEILPCNEKKSILTAKTSDFKTPLIIAAQYQSGALNDLLNSIDTLPFDDSKAALMDKNSEGWNLLMIAAYYQAEAVNYILLELESLSQREKLSFLMQETITGYTSLMLAVQYQPNCVPSILNSIKNLSEKEKERVARQKTSVGYSILILAAQQPTIVKAIVSFIETLPENTRQMILSERTLDSYTPLMFAIRYQPSAVNQILNCIKTLSEKEKERALMALTSEGYTPLMLAIRYQPSVLNDILNNMEFLTKEVKQNALLELTYDGYTPLTYALQYQHSVVLQILNVHAINTIYPVIKNISKLGQNACLLLGNKLLDMLDTPASRKNYGFILNVLNELIKIKGFNKILQYMPYFSKFAFKDWQIELKQKLCSFQSNRSMAPELVVRTSTLSIMVSLMKKQKTEEIIGKDDEETMMYIASLLYDYSESHNPRRHYKDQVKALIKNLDEETLSKKLHKVALFFDDIRSQKKFNKQGDMAKIIDLVSLNSMHFDKILQNIQDTSLKPY